jgi:hypothetical protein
MNNKPLTLKLATRIQAESLYYYFENFVIPVEPEDVAEGLIKDLMVKIFKKLRNKVEKEYDCRGFGIQITPDEAKAYFLYWQNRAIHQNYTLEKCLIEAHIAQIDRIYG